MGSLRPPSAPLGNRKTTDLLNKQLKQELQGGLPDAGEVPLGWPALLRCFSFVGYFGGVGRKARVEARSLEPPSILSDDPQNPPQATSSRHRYSKARALENETKSCFEGVFFQFAGENATSRGLGFCDSQWPNGGSRRGAVIFL